MRYFVPALTLACLLPPQTALVGCMVEGEYAHQAPARTKAGAPRWVAEEEEPDEECRWLAEGPNLADAGIG